MKLKPHRVHTLRRKTIPFLHTARFGSTFLYFLFGFFIALTFFPRSVLTPADQQQQHQQQQPRLDLDTYHNSSTPIIRYVTTAPRTVQVKVPVTVPVYLPDNSFADAWLHSTETCRQWISIQRQTRSYLDAYVVGSQKGATSELSKNLFNLGVRRPNMVKEWHFFNRLDDEGDIGSVRALSVPLPPLNLSRLRVMHFATGFSKSLVANLSSSDESLPLVDDSEEAVRQLSLDMTVEYLHSDRSAFLAYLLTPHAKIIITIRNPMERALSQYNMNIRNGNKIRRRLGVPDRSATPEEFDHKIRAEIRKLRRCGYHKDTGLLDGKTSQLIACMFNNSRAERFDDALYVARGLYHLHIRTWRDHFPDEHILVISFEDISLGKRTVYQALTQFLCVRPYPESWLEAFEKQGSPLSFGQLAAEKGLEKGGFDSYQGNDKYLPSMLPETEELLREFYSAADKQLRAMLGSHYVYWSNTPEEELTS